MPHVTLAAGAVRLYRFLRRRGVTAAVRVERSSDGTGGPSDNRLVIPSSVSSDRKEQFRLRWAAHYHASDIKLPWLARLVSSSAFGRKALILCYYQIDGATEVHVGRCGGDANMHAGVCRQRQAVCPRRQDAGVRLVKARERRWFSAQVESSTVEGIETIVHSSQLGIHRHAALKGRPFASGTESQTKVVIHETGGREFDIETSAASGKGFIRWRVAVMNSTSYRQRPAEGTIVAGPRLLISAGRRCRTANDGPAISRDP